MEQHSLPPDVRPLSEDLRFYFNLLWHWAWLIALAGVLAGIITFFVSRSLTPVYEAETTVLVDQGASSSTSEYQSILMSERLTQTYADLLTQNPVLEEVLEELELDLDLEDFRETITVQPVRDTQLIEIKVENQSAGSAMRIANTLVEVFIAQNTARQSARYAASKANLEAQLERVDQNIEDTSQAIEELGDGLENEAQRGQLELTLSQYRATYASLLGSYEEIRQAEAESVSNLVQVEPAGVPLEPVRPRTLVNTALAGVVGGMLALGAVFLLDALDDSVKDPDQLERVLELPILAMLPQHAEEEERVIALEKPRHPVVEAFRALRTNIRYSSVDREIKTLLITSADPGVGKTSTASNLAAVLAQGGSKTLLVDADLRKPKIHRVLGLENHLGFSDLFLEEDPDLGELIQTDLGGENLHLLTSGATPPNPAELLGSQKMVAFLEAFKADYDYIVIDSPPLMAVTDAAVLSRAADGALLVIKPGTTKVGALEGAVEGLRRVGAHILGLVLNEIPARGSRYYYQGYQYYRYDEYQDQESSD